MRKKSRKQNVDTTNVYPNIEIIDNTYGEWRYPPTGKPYFAVCGRAVWVLDVFLELETGKEYMTLKYIMDTVSNETNTVTIPRSWISNRNLEKLCEIGIDAQANNARVVIALIQKQEMVIVKSYKHSSIGFTTILTQDGNEELIFKHTETIGTVKSSYNGSKDIACKGSYKAWKQMVADEIIGVAPLEFAVILGLSAALVGYFDQFVGTESLLVHLCGDSSSGKTTTAKIAVSTSGNPSFVGNTLMSTCLSTKNAMTKKVSNNNGFPQVFDEISMFSGNLTELIYTLASGKEKERLNKDCSMRSSENWATTIITTGEKNILNDAKQNAGLSVRVLIFDSIKWTKDAEHAERIQKVIEQNYGHAILKFAEYLIKASHDTIFKKLEYWRQRYLELYAFRNQINIKL